jgi:hypothetical protein
LRTLSRRAARGSVFPRKASSGSSSGVLTLHRSRIPTRAHFVRLGNDKSGGGGKLTKRCKNKVSAAPRLRLVDGGKEL